MQALILAGGRGMRLNPLANEVPIPLLHLPGGTILDYSLHQISQLKIDRVALILQYRGDQIARYLADQHDEPFTLIPQYAPFTFLSALASAAPWVEEPTLVVHGNCYFSNSLSHLVQESDPATPSFLLCPEDVEQERIGAAGAYLLPPEIFYLAARLVEKDSLAVLHSAMRAEKWGLQALPMQGWARSINTATDLLMVNRYLLTHWHEIAHPPGAGVGYDALNFSWISPKAEVGSKVSSLFVTVGPGASVEGSYLYNSLLLPGVHIHDTKEQHAILARSAHSLLRLYVPATATASVGCG
ncbi:MAG: nucleotidyltransferase family protein [Ardenticatenaceae bacterium]